MFSLLSFLQPLFFICLDFLLFSSSQPITSRVPRLLTLFSLPTGQSPEKRFWQRGSVRAEHVTGGRCAYTLYVHIRHCASDSVLTVRDIVKGVAKIARKLGFDFGEAVVCSSFLVFHSLVLAYFRAADWF